MNIIINDSNTKIGGIEVLFIEITKYLINNGHNVYFLVKNRNSIYEKAFREDNRIIYINRKL